MHPSFKLSNVARLPYTYREQANAALRGSPEALKTLLDEIPCISPEYLPLLIPAFYAGLDNDDIPTILNRLDSSTSLASIAGIRPRIAQILISLRGMLRLGSRGALPSAAMLYLWPRVWTWVKSLDTSRDNLPDNDLSDSQTYFLYIALFNLFRGNDLVWEEFVSGAGTRAALALLVSSHIERVIPNVDTIVTEPTTYRLAGVFYILEEIFSGNWDIVFREALLYLGITNDGQDGGHREMCNSSYPKKDAHISTKDRSVIRALMLHDYLTAKETLAMDYVRFIHTEPDFFPGILFDYVGGKCEFKLGPPDGLEDEFAYDVRRTLKSEGRMQLHMMKMYVGEDPRARDRAQTQFRMFPMRSETAGLIYGLRFIGNLVSSETDAEFCRSNVRELLKFEELEAY
ncbi:hypothetical protein B0H19DRAFT_1386335 [Mycena capillaripes]|nr:hypothetical protein B0H19DRAFT_1386335 [Mycena capillaripes]